MMRHLLILIAGFVVVGMMYGTVAVNAQSSEREQQLEQKVEQLTDQVKTLMEHVQNLESKVNQQTESQEALEEKVEEVKTTPTQKDNDINWTWKNGLNFGSNDGNYKFKLGGRVQNDWFAGTIDNGDFPDGTRFRRLWLNFQGSIYEDYEFRVQYDIAGGSGSSFKDVYMGYTGLDFMNIRLGQFREPFSMEELTPNYYLTIMERSPLNSLTPSRETGIQFYNEILDKRMTWAVGAFKNVNGFGDGDEDDTENGDWDLAARLTGLPWYEEDGRKLVHLGIAGLHREWGEDPYRLRTRGGYSRGDRLVDTGNINVDTIDEIGGEFAVVYGPAMIQSEYVHAEIDTVLAGSNSADAFYVQGSYFLTGEHRPYKGGLFTRVIPNDNFSLKDGGLGAWELIARYGFLDADDLAGGEIDDYVVGLNWYLNPNTEIMWNYVHSEAENNAFGDQDADVYQMRIQINF